MCWCISHSTIIIASSKMLIYANVLYTKAFIRHNIQINNHHHNSTRSSKAATGWDICWQCTLLWLQAAAPSPHTGNGVGYWGEPKQAPHKWCLSRFSVYILYNIYIYIYVYIYLPSVIPYIHVPVVYFNDMQYFIPLRACAHDTGDTSQVRESEQTLQRREREQAHRVATI